MPADRPGSVSVKSLFKSIQVEQNHDNTNILFLHVSRKKKKKKKKKRKTTFSENHKTETVPIFSPKSL